MRLLIAILSACLSLTAQEPGLEKFVQERYCMGTICHVAVFAHDQDEADKAFSVGFGELHRIENLLSNWKSDSGLMRLNREAAAGPVEARPWISVDTELYDCVQRAIRIAGQTNGLFDPTVAPLVRAWGFLPPCTQNCPHSIEDAKTRVGWNKVHFRGDDHGIQFAVPGMEIDLGGIAKGYAAGRAVALLKKAGIASGYVSLGESSIQVFGIEQPIEFKIRDTGESVSLQGDESLATSGTDEHQVGKGANRRAHIINPLTGQALKGELVVVVVDADPELADALTKPFMLGAGTTTKLSRDTRVLRLGRDRHGKWQKESVSAGMGRTVVRNAASQ